MPTKLEILAKVVRQIGDQIESGDTFDLLAQALETGGEDEIIKTVTALRGYAHSPLLHERPLVARNLEELADKIEALTPEEIANGQAAVRQAASPYWGLSRRHAILLAGLLVGIAIISGILIFILIHYGK